MNDGQKLKQGLLLLDSITKVKRGLWNEPSLIIRYLNSYSKSLVCRGQTP